MQRENKTTEELNNEIKAVSDIEDYLKENKGSMLSCSLAEHLNTLLKKKGINRGGDTWIYGGSYICL